MPSSKPIVLVGAGVAALAAAYMLLRPKKKTKGAIRRCDCRNRARAHAAAAALARARALAQGPSGPRSASAARRRSGRTKTS